MNFNSKKETADKKERQGADEATKLQDEQVNASEENSVSDNVTDEGPEQKELEELTDLLISPFVKEGKPVVDRTKFSSYVDVKEDEIKQALSNKGYPIYETYFTAGLGPEGTDKLKTLKYPTDEVQKQNWLTYMSGGINMAVKNLRCFAMSVRSIGGEDYFIALVVGEKVPH